MLEEIIERPNFGGIKLPIGYRFHPTDEELVVHYLKRKVLGLPLPASVIPELDVFGADPWSLPGDLKEKRYFFSRNEKATNGKTSAGSGYWKVTNKTRQIEASINKQPVGIRKTLVFCQGKKSARARTQWAMHEFHLLGSNQQMELGDWVVCRVFMRKRRPKRQEGISKADGGPSFVELDNSENAGPPHSSSPCSSGITEVSCCGFDQEEVTSLISFSAYSCMIRKI